MRENDLALISAAVYAYLNSEGQNNAEAPRKKAAISSLRPLRISGTNSWRWSFAPAIDKKGHRIYQWSR
jgi:hypothetical protein